MTASNEVGQVLRKARPTKDIEGARALAGIRSRLFGRKSAPVRVGRYELAERLGAGGLGVVYAAHDPKLDREVAVKLLRQVPGVDPVREQNRLQREGRAMAQLSHPNVIEVFDVGTYEGLTGIDCDDVDSAGGGVFIVMARLRGQTLQQWIDTRRPWAEVLDVFLAAGEGLVAAHAAGLVHRDFKPANVFIEQDGRVRVLDFGLARGHEPGRSITIDGLGGSETVDPYRSVTVAGAVLGTPAYMAPEQHDAGSVDARTDQYSFCAALYQGLFGVRPFSGESLDVLATQKQGLSLQTVSEVQVPRWLATAIRRGLNPEPNDRWPSVATLLHELRRRRRRTSRRLLGLGSVLSLGAVGLLASGSVWTQGPQCEEVEDSVQWSEATAGSIEQSLAAHPAGQRALSPVLSGLATYASTWHDEHQRLCEAVTQTQTQTQTQIQSAQVDARMRCLRRAGVHFDTVVETLAHADARVAERASSAVRTLPELSRCHDEEALAALHGTGEPLPETEQTESIRTQLARVSALVTAGDIDQAQAKATECREYAEGVDHPPLQAEALWWEGHVRRIRGDYEAALPGLEQAAHTAAAHGHDKIAALAAVELSRIHQSMARFDEALEWARHAEAAALRFGSDRYPLARAYGVRAGILRDLGRKEEAYELYGEALEVQMRADATGHELPTLLNNLGTTALLLGRYEEAREHYERSYQRIEEILGAEHPQTASARMNLGIVTASQGHYEQAMEHYEAARESIVRLFGEKDQRVAYCDTNIGNLLLDQRKFEAARDRFAAARDLFAELLGPGHPNTVTNRASWGLAQLELGQPQQARPALERALADMTEAVGAEHPQIAILMGQVGQALLAEGNLPAARERMEAGLALVKKTETEPGRQYEIRFHLARLQWEEGEHSAAWSEVQDVLAWAKAHGSDAERAQIERWVQEHPRPEE